MADGIEHLWQGIGAALTLAGAALYLWALNRVR
jgi:hypothetical protein